MTTVTAVTAEKPAADRAGLDRPRVQRLGRDPDGKPLVSLAMRLYQPMPTDRLVGWIASLSVTLLAGVMRFHALANPQKIIFDETYYAKDAYSLLKYGYARQFIDTPKGEADRRLMAGNLDIFVEPPSPSMVVHPDGGKWMIAAGEQLFGMNSFGWRFSAFVVGTLMIMVLIRLVRRLARSTLIGCIAGLLLAFDGLHFVMSRMALLDIFMAFWMLCGVACVVTDRDWARKRLVAGLPDEGGIGTIEHSGQFGRRMLWRPWRVAAGVCFGLALASKWDAIWILAIMGLLTWAWDLSARRAIGGRAPIGRSIVFDAIPAFCAMVLVALVTYVLTWAGWFAHDGAYGRDWAENNPAHGVMQIVPDDLRSFVNYQHEVLKFHTGSYMENATHPYASNPAGWPFLARPIGIDAINDIPQGSPGCNAKGKTSDGKPENCVAVISANGTPLLWWGGILAMIAGLVFWIGQRDWRFSVPVLGFVMSWVPWMPFADRTIFFFYAVSIIPFTVIAVALCLGKILGPARPGSTRRLVGSVLVGAYVILVVVNFAYMYPIYTDQILTRTEWLNRMWFKSWI